MRQFPLAMLLLVVALSCAASAAKPRLEFWTQSLSPKFDPFFRGLAAEFNATHPEVEAVWVDYPWSVIRTKFTAALAAGNPPALVNIDVPWLYTYEQMGLLRPVDDLIHREDYLASALADDTFDGRVYAFPFYNGANVIAYNTELFRKAGLDPKCPPTTLDQQIAYAKQIRIKTGVAGFAPALGPTKVEGLMQQEGLEVLHDGKAAFNTPAHIALIAKLADAYQSGAIFKEGLFAADDFQAEMSAFTSQRIAILVSSPTALSRVKSDAPDVYRATEVAGVPLGPEKIVWSGWQFTFAMAKNVNPANAKAIGELGRFLTNARNQVAFARLAGTLPTSASAANDPFFTSLPSNAGAVEKGVVVAAGGLPYTRTIYLKGVKNAEMLSTELSAEVEQAVTGRKDPKLALDTAVAFWNQHLSSTVGRN